MKALLYSGMTKSIYVAATEPRSGKSLASLGLMELASRRVERVGFFRPIIRSDEPHDRQIDLMRARYGIQQPAKQLFALSYEEARQLVESRRTNELLQRILARHAELASQCDFLVCEGTSYSGVTAAFEFEFNAQVAGHLGCPVFFVANGREGGPEQLFAAVGMARRAFVQEGCSVVATLINRVPPRQAHAVRDRFRAEWPHKDPMYVVPEDERLGQPTIAELIEVLDGRLVHGDGAQLQNVASDYVIADMHVTNVLERLRKGTLVITAGDRAEVLLGCLASLRAENYPNISGIVLTGGLDLSPAIAQLVDGMHQLELPVVSVAADTFACAGSIQTVHPSIAPGDERKIATALGLFEEHVPVAELEDRVRVTRSARVTPLRFEYELIGRAKVQRQHIVLPEGSDERILRAAEILLRRGVADLTLLGNPAQVGELEATLGVDLQGAQIVDPLTSEWRDEFAKTYHELRRHKGVNEEMAYDAVSDVSYFGTMMVYSGLADGMVSGAVHTTAHTIRPSLEVIRTSEGVSVVSSVFLMCLEDRVVVYGDCAVNPRPNPEQLADIAISSAETAAIFGIEPRVAMLSYSTGESGSGEEVDKVREAVKITKQRRPDLKLDGPIQYDAAVDASVARQKLPGSEVAGRATVFIFPDLNTGNNTYKAVQRSSGAIAIGPVLQGLRKPINDLSRGCTIPDIVNTVAVTAIQAQAERSSR